MSENRVGDNAGPSVATTDTADWPERFIYVCNATKFAITNIAPIFHAGGPQKIVRAVIFCAAQEDSTDPTDLGQAIQPAKTLLKWLEDRQVPCEIEYQKTRHEDPGQWADSLRALTRGEWPVVYNAAGGRTLTKIGAIWFPLGNLSVVATEGSPLRTYLVREVDGRPTLFSPPRRSEVDLASLLEANDQAEVNVGQREISQKNYKKLSQQIEAFWDAAQEAGMDAVRQVNALVTPIANRDPFRPETIRFQQTIFNVVAKLDGTPGLRFEARSGQVQFTSKFAAKLVSGGWLEGLIYNRLRRDIPNGAQIFTGVKLAHSDREIDIAVMIRGQLHVIEAKAAEFRKRHDNGEKMNPKTVKNSRENRQKAVNQIVKLRSYLISSFGRAWIVNPTVSTGDYSYMTGQCDAQVLIGPGALDQLSAEVRALIDKVETSLKS